MIVGGLVEDSATQRAEPVSEHLGAASRRPRAADPTRRAGSPAGTPCWHSRAPRAPSLQCDTVLRGGQRIAVGAHHDPRAATAAYPKCWWSARIPNVRYSFGRTVRFVWARGYTTVSDSLRLLREYARPSSGQVLLVDMRLATSTRVPRAGSPRSSKSSRAARNSKRVAPCRRARRGRR